MNIELIYQKLSETESSWKYKPLQYCCDFLKTINLVRLIDEPPDRGNTYHLGNTNVPQMMICSCNHNMDSEYYRLDYVPIRYCPFCGEPIKISVVARQDRSDEYCGLYDKRNELYRQIDKRMPTKERKELESKISDIDKQIDYLEEFCEFSEK